MKTTKIELRKLVLSQRSELNEEQLTSARTIALEKLLTHPDYVSAQTVMVYMDFRKEVPTASILENILSSGKRLALPLTDGHFAIVPYEIPAVGLGEEKEKYFTLSQMGIFEPDPNHCQPIDPQEIDFIIVPGAVFDHQGNRIGYGKGCYDRFLPLLRKEVKKIGLAYDFQILDQVPAEPQDINMDEVLVISVPN